MTNEGRPSELEKECENATALFASESGKQGNLLKGIDKKTVRREGIEPIRRVFTYVTVTQRFVTNKMVRN